jgi:hypothetical protein
MNVGAWGPCPTCGFQPAGVEQLAKAMMLTDHWLPAVQLEEFSARRKQGEPWVFSSELVEQVKARVAALLPLTPDGHPALAAGESPRDGEAKAKV